MDNLGINQCALFVSSSDRHPDEFIKLVIGENSGIPYQAEDGELTAYPWHVNTKYYEADVYLCSLASKILVSKHLASTVQAFILYFDSSQTDGLNLAESWLPFLINYDAEVKILLSDRCTENPETGVSKLAAQEWCIKNGFELVEIDPELSDYDSEQDFMETTGIQRVIQALHAHVWPNMTLKERREPTSFSALLHGDLTQSDENNVCDGLGDLHLGSGLDQANIEGKIEELFGAGLSDGDDMDFSALFGQLQEMKERVSSMSNDQRKNCAERVVLAFWKAIGGDSEEIDMNEDG